MVLNILIMAILIVFMARFFIKKKVIIPNDIKVKGKYVGLPKYLTRKLNFVEDVGSFDRRFTRIYVENNNLFIGHTFNKGKIKIEYKDLEDWIKYFDRI